MVPVSFPIKMEPYRKSHSKKELLKRGKTTFPDGTYQIFETKNGKPCKKIFTYSKNGTLLDLDWFDHCRSVKELNASAVTLDYETLINTPYNYSDIPVKLSGTVVELYEIPTHGYIKIRDTDNHLFLFNYPNTSIQSAFSTNIENVSIGDTIDIYGMLDSINDYSQNQLSLYEHSLGYQMDFDTFENLITDSDFLASIKYCSTIDDNDLKSRFQFSTHITGKQMKQISTRCILLSAMKKFASIHIITKMRICP